MKGAPECMRISKFLHGVNNHKLKKRLNEHVPKIVEEIMTATTAFIQGETAAASKKKVHTPWKSQDQSKQHTSKRKFKPPPFMVTPVEKRSSNKFCEFYNDKGHNTDECMQLRKQIEELVRACKLSHFIKEIRQRLLDGGDAKHYTKAWMNIMIVRPPSPYNSIIGRHVIREIQAVPSTAHGILKLSVNGGIVTICSTILTPTECATIAATPKDSAKKTESRHENFKVAIYPDFLDQEITIGGTVSTKARMEFCTLLKGNLDIFAWQPSDMTGVPRSIAKHRLDIREGYSPVRQKKGQAPEHAKAIQVEVQKLVGAGILRQVYYHDWLSNPVMVESLYGYPFKCFLDAYKGYHQIQMSEQDEEKTALHTSHGVYCYTKMPFGLKNAGATYQQLVNKAFDRKIGRNMKIYMDDLVIKSHTKTELLRDIEETFCDGLIPTSPEGIKFTYALRFQFTASNNEAEYEALIAGLRITAQIGVRNMHSCLPRTFEVIDSRCEQIYILSSPGWWGFTFPLCLHAARVISIMGAISTLVSGPMRGGVLPFSSDFLGAFSKIQSGLDFFSLVMTLPVQYDRGNDGGNDPCTRNEAPLTLSWERIPRLDSGVRACISYIELQNRTPNCDIDVGHKEVN
nr:reverse transcriptase domain-containing protein [Tanacetum cinerariifolium]